MKKILLLLFIALSFTAQSQTVGWFYSNPGSTDGYILFPPSSNDTTYLMDKCGKRIHTWYSDYHAGLSAYLLNDGTMFRQGYTGNNQFQGGGSGGILELFDWDSNLLWSYKISSDTDCQHHDAYPLPNGNYLAIAWEYHTKTDAVNNGRDPGNIGSTKMWSDKLIEIKPTGPNTGIVVWEWRAWDHLVQEFDATKMNYGAVKDHPELLDLNLGSLSNFNPDWLHVNGLDYDSVTDQLLVSCHNLNEVWIIDHSTTMAESASHSGGNSGHGGDILYRWGNPKNYQRGTTADQKLFNQHNPTWIKPDCPGAGSIMLFNNGVGRPGTDYSSVDVFTPPTMVNYNYPLEVDSAYEPDEQSWIYTSNPLTELFSMVMGGAQRLPNGNTLICEAVSGVFTEVDTQSNSLWKYVNPVGNNITHQGSNPVNNSSFRCTYIPFDHPGLAGQSLVPGSPIEINPLNYTCTNSIPTEVVDAISRNEKMVVYPNPFQYNFIVHIPSELKNGSLNVYDVTGRLLYKEASISSASSNDHAVSISGYTGMVLITVDDASGKNLWRSTAIAE